MKRATRQRARVARIACPWLITRWDVPAVGDGYAAARDRIVANVERRVAELAAAR